MQAVSKRKWVWLWLAALVVDEVQERARVKDGAVARGMIFDSNSSLACNKASFRYPHHHQMPNETAHRTKFLMRSLIRLT